MGRDDYRRWLKVCSGFYIFPWGSPRRSLKADFLRGGLIYDFLDVRVYGGGGFPGNDIEPGG